MVGCILNIDKRTNPVVENTKNVYIFGNFTGKKVDHMKQIEFHYGLTA